MHVGTGAYIQGDAMISEAQLLFNDTWHRAIGNWHEIFCFREVAQAGLPSAERVIALRRQALARDFLLSGECDEIFTGASDEFRDSIAQTIRDSTHSTMEVGQRAIDAASLVFVHSVIDAAAYDYCCVTALASPDDWKPFVIDKQVKLAEVFNNSLDELMRANIDRCVGDLERRSLLCKIDRLFTVCAPLPGWSPMMNYAYERERIQLFDDVRHDIVHGLVLRHPIADVETELDYLSRTTQFLMCLVNNRYKLKLIPGHRLRDTT
jgi:hypothetical protein